MVNTGQNRQQAYPFLWGGASDIGRMRQQNEDAFVISPEDGLLLVVDGMGGHPGGDVAAGIAAKALPAAVRGRLAAMQSRRPASIRQWLTKSICEQNAELFLQAASMIGCEGMGATVAMVLLLDDRAYAANLGDSRIYRLRAGKLTQWSRDHSVIAELLDRGEIGPADTPNHPARGLVTQFLGMPERARPSVRSFALKPGDRLLLCSDGLTDQVKDETIGQLLDGQPDCQATCDVLIQMANAKGGIDNVTVVLAHWTGPRMPASSP